MRECNEQRFLSDVAEHRVTVLLDNGTYRHVRFRKPGTYCMGFDLVTWPGFLAYSGDMGEFVFQRLEDMFEFFRDPQFNEKQRLYINPSYWGEKCRAADTSGNGIKEFQPEQFREAITRRLDDMEASDELREEVDDEVLSRADDGQHEAMRAAIDFTHEGRCVFTDFWEADPTDYTYRFIWCCYALAWGIRQYDDARATTSDSVRSEPDAPAK